MHPHFNIESLTLPFTHIFFNASSYIAFITDTIHSSTLSAHQTTPKAPYQMLSPNQQEPPTGISSDCVVHEILLTCLQRCYGISGIVLQWIKSYLEGRSQFVKIQNESSETEDLSRGVTQGSCLGPFLYCVYVSTLASVVPQNVSFHQYADDTKLYCGFKTSDYQNGVKALEDCSAAIERWFLCNGLLLNAEKSDAVILSTSQQASKIPVNSSIRVAGYDIQLSDSVRNLGVVIDSRLSFDEHVSSVCRSCYFHMKAFR